MNIPIQTFIEICSWDTSRFLIFSDNVFAPLIYYSHFFALIPSFLIGLFVFLKNKKARVNQALFFITTLFSLWVFADLVLWANERPDLIMFFWSLQVIIEPLIYAACVYFVYVFVTKKDPGTRTNLIIMTFLAPTLLLASTKLALTGFDLTNCYRETGEGPVTLYGYAIEVLYLLWILIFAFDKFRKVDKEERLPIFFITTGIILFLLSLVSGNIVGSLTENWTLAQAGLFGMPIFVAFLAYMIVRFKAFNAKLIGAQALVFALGFLILGIIFIRTIDNVRLVALATFGLIVVVGYLLIRSVKREIEQREQLAELIKQREALVHLVTHKVKGSFTRSKYIFAGLLDGTFGPITPEIKKYAEQGLESNDMGIETVDLVLNADNLQKGIVKYDMKPFDMKEIVARVIAEKDASIKAKGLTLEANLGEGNFNVLGDSFWIKEVVNNLIENSIKYTPKGGKINVELTDGNGKIKLAVKDDGVGISPEDMAVLFTEGGRGKDAVKINVDSTGYGLYSVKLILDVHKGRVWAESLGRDKGSQFYVELDALA